MLRAALIAAVTAVIGAGCATREAPYRFRSPMLGGVHAAEVEPPRVPADPTADGPPARSFPAHRHTRVNPPELEPGESPPVADVLRGLVGHRDADSSDLEFAFQAAAAVGAELDPEVARLDRGAQLVALARRRAAIGTPRSALVGDLVVFMRGRLVGVVASRRRDGTIEFVYLAGGVVRRGWVNPDSPGVKRSDDGRVLNTFVRHENGGSSRLAGQLLAAVIKLDRLTR